MKGGKIVCMCPDCDGSRGASMRPAREGRENGVELDVHQRLVSASMRPAREGRENSVRAAVQTTARRRFNEARP